MKRKIIWQLWKEPLEDQEDDEDGDNSTPYPVMKTPHGFISLKIHAPLKNDLVFWVGHTNFDITQSVKYKILQTEGVEIFDVFAPYRFRVCFGLAFDAEKIKRKINRTLCFNRNAGSLPDEVKHLKLDLKLSQKNWAILVLPNDKFSYFTTDNIQDFDKKIENYKIAQREIGGKILVGYKPVSNS